MLRDVIQGTFKKNPVKQKRKCARIFASESDGKKRFQKSQSKMHRDIDFLPAKIAAKNHKSDGLFLF